MRIVLLNQTFYPDVVATAQYLSTLARELAARGHEVTVIASKRAYDEPDRRHAASEKWKGIQIYRVGSTGFGKGAKWKRAADFASFIVFCCWRLLRLRRPDVVMALTSPPLISFIGAGYAAMRRCRFVYWVMDLNPDEAIAAGWVREGTRAARILNWMSKKSLRRSDRVIALDRFMAERIEEKGVAKECVAIIPPWSHEVAAHFDAAGREEFRGRHGLNEKFVVMYSGNHSPCHPLDTLMEAARLLAGDVRIIFLFVGGGSEQGRVKLWAAEQGLTNIRCLPYQPLEGLAASLSAADLQVVVMGEPFVGIIHPCKIYNILAVGAPFLYIGPQPSHVTDLMAALPDSRWCGRVSHGDAVAAVQFIRAAAAAKARPEPGRFETVAARFSQARLLAAQVELLERVASG